ncbi:hypothetical protein OAN96_00165 [Candidatus Gracilibacteria bacterium]|nr:hypothetical protein [Candidatus Gracilibacteria bacterium]
MRANFIVKKGSVFCWLQQTSVGIFAPICESSNIAEVLINLPEHDRLRALNCNMPSLLDGYTLLTDSDLEGARIYMNKLFHPRKYEVDTARKIRVIPIARALLNKRNLI